MQKPFHGSQPTRPSFGTHLDYMPKVFRNLYVQVLVAIVASCLFG